MPFCPEVDWLTLDIATGEGLHECKEVGTVAILLCFLQVEHDHNTLSLVVGDQQCPLGMVLCNLVTNKCGTYIFNHDEAKLAVLINGFVLELKNGMLPKLFGLMSELVLSDSFAHGTVGKALEANNGKDCGVGSLDARVGLLPVFHEPGNKCRTEVIILAIVAR